MNNKIDMPASYVTGVLGASGGYDQGRLISAKDPRRICGVATFLKAPLLKDVPDATIGIGVGDLTEVSPLHDVGQTTAYLGAQLLFEMVSIIPPTRQH